MHHVRIQDVHEIRWRSCLSLIAGIVDLRSRCSICSARRNPIAVIRQKRSVDEIRSLVRRRGIQNPELWRNQVGAGQSKIGWEVAEHRWRIEHILSKRDSKTAGRRAYQNAVAGGIEVAQQ